MSESMFFAIAVFVFVLLATGLVLTVIEFRSGSPHRQQKRAERQKEKRALRGAEIDPDN